MDGIISFLLKIGENFFIIIILCENFPKFNAFQNFMSSILFIREREQLGTNNSTKLSL